MPLLRIQTNAAVDPDKQSRLLARASSLVSELLGKPEQYVMVSIESDNAMLFSGTDAGLAFLELKSIGLPESSTGDLSQSLCNLISEELEIEPVRIYIEFSDAPRKMWGWNGATF